MMYDYDSDRWRSYERWRSIDITGVHTNMTYDCHRPEPEEVKQKDPPTNEGHLAPPGVGSALKKKDRAISRQLPPPQAQSFLVCRHIHENKRTQEVRLVGPFGGIRLHFFPSLFRMSVYAQLTGGHGTYRLALQLRDDEDEVPWAWEWPKPIEHINPLEPYRIILHDALIEFPQPGRFALILLANGEEVARHMLQVIEAPAG